MLLTGGGRAAVDRHHSLQAALDWSYELLTEPERSLFCLLSVFRGGFTFEAVNACFSAGSDQLTLDLLTRLVDTSLVVSDLSHPARYSMLETIREYAAAKLFESGESGDAYRSHASYFASVLADYTAEVEEGHRAAPFERLRAEEANIRAAFDWATTSEDSDSAARRHHHFFRDGILRCVERAGVARQHDGDRRFRARTA